MPSPFDLNNTESYLRWRERKLEAAQTSINELVVEVRDPRALTASEHSALADRVRRCNMAIYGTPTAITTRRSGRFAPWCCIACALPRAAARTS